jgi:DnaJ-class molecular chaperone
MDYRQRKAARTAYYESYVVGNKDTVCSACSGSGYYDSLNKWGRAIRCGSCNGTGTEKSTYMPPREQFMRDWHKQSEVKN